MSANEWMRQHPIDVLDYLPNAVVPGIAGIIAAAIGIPDRARWEEE